MTATPCTPNYLPAQKSSSDSVDFDPVADADALKQAIGCLGCDNATILRTICQRSNAQRQEIRRTYQTAFGHDLIKRLKSALFMHFKDVIVALTYSPAEYDAKQLRRALKIPGLTDPAIVEILTTRTKEEIENVKQVYARMYSEQLEDTIRASTAGSLRHLLISLSKVEKLNGVHTNMELALKDAMALHEAGEKRLGTDESVFNEVFGSRTHDQLQLVFQEYEKLAGHGIETAVEKEFKGPMQNALLTMTKIVRNPTVYFAKQLHSAMKGPGTDDPLLIRIIVSRSERDLVQIKEEFFNLYGKPLRSVVKGDTTGLYEDALLTIIDKC